MIRKLRHIGMVVDDLERAIKRFEGFGLKCKETTEVEELGVRMAFVPIGDTLIEILYYAEPEKLPRVLRDQKGPLNHICLEVDDLDSSIEDFLKGGAKLLEGFPKSGAHGRVAFFYPESTEGVLIEICQV